MVHQFIVPLQLECMWGLGQLGGAQEEWAFKREPIPLAVLPSPCHPPALWTGNVEWDQDWAFDLGRCDPSLALAFLAL